MNKKKIMLGAYFNNANAQNINCKNIALNLDKEKFEVHGLYVSDEPIDLDFYKTNKIIMHKVRVPYFAQMFKYRLLKKTKCDIYYLPKREKADIKFAEKYCKKVCTLSSVEGVITETANNSEEYRSYYFDKIYKTFSISKCIAESVKKFYGVDTDVLNLGVNRKDDCSFKSNLKSVIWVGNFTANKQPRLLVECAKAFPELSFVMIGGGVLFDETKNTIIEQGIKNVTLTGRISNDEVYEYMKKSDLLLMTSENEGLPKVIQEAAECCVPSVYINKNYAIDFITDGTNGYGVKNLEEMINTVRTLKDDSDKLRQVSARAKETIKDYEWSALIKQYEAFFENTLKQFEDEYKK